ATARSTSCASSSPDKLRRVVPPRARRSALFSCASASASVLMVSVTTLPHKSASTCGWGWSCEDHLHPTGLIFLVGRPRKLARQPIARGYLSIPRNRGAENTLEPSKPRGHLVPTI